MAKRARLVRIVTRLNVGGPAIHTTMLTREMQRFGFSTLLVSGSCEREDGDMSYLLGNEKFVCWIPELSRSVHPFRNFLALWRIWRVLRRESPLIVHTHTAMAGCLGRIAAKLAGVPIIVHTFHGNSLQQYFSPLASLVFLRVERILATFTDAICVICEQQFHELSDTLRVGPPQKFQVIPLGLDLSPYLTLEYPHLENEPLNVVWLGRLVAIKGVDILIDVIQRAVNEALNVRFIVAGDGPEGSAIASLAQKYPKQVTWLGWQQDVVPLIQSAHVLLQTSRNEGTPVALIQGMAAGRPFVSTSVGGIVDMVKAPELMTTGECHWFPNAVLTPQDPEALVSVLREFTKHPKLIPEMGTNARAFAASRYKKELLFSNLNSLYESLIQSKSTNSKVRLRYEQSLLSEQ